jgi:hypothetical protein
MKRLLQKSERRHLCGAFLGRKSLGRQDCGAPAGRVLKEPLKTRPCSSFLLLAWIVTAASALAANEGFDRAKPGEPPPGWTATQTGSGDPKWTVEKDESAPSPSHVLKQSGVAAFAICLKQDSNIKNGFVEVKFKPVSGQTDQAGGLIWRCQDADNYYVARANALEDNVTIYHTLQGRRVAFQNAEVKVRAGEWHTLRVDFSGHKFTVSFDGRRVIEASDDHIPKAGRVGVWTKADSVTLFDDFKSQGQ